MNTNLDLKSLLNGLKSDDPETLLAALHESSEVIHQIFERAVQAIKHPEMGRFAAERIYGVMASMVEELENFMQSSTVLEEKVHAATLLLSCGATTGVAFLREAVELDLPYSAWVAHKLANAGLAEAKDSIVLRLRSTELSRTDEIESLLSALKKVKGNLPPDLESRFLSEEAPEDIREFVHVEWTSHTSSLIQETQEVTLRA